MTHDEKNQLLRQYAAGEISWTSLRGRGFENYRDVLAGLGRLHLLRSSPSPPWTARTSRLGVARGRLSGERSSRRRDDPAARSAGHRRLAAAEALECLTMPDIDRSGDKTYAAGQRLLIREFRRYREFADLIEYLGKDTIPKARHK